MGDKQSKPTVVLETKVATKEPVPPALVDVAKTKSLVDAGQYYDAFEASLPLGLMHYREFEGRMKKLAYDTGLLTLRQIYHVFARKFPDFA